MSLATGYDLEALQIRDTFKVHTWQTLPDALMLHEQGGYFFLSKRGLKYYLPAYLGFAVRAYAEADSIPDGLIFSLTLPTVPGDLATARQVAQLAAQRPEMDWRAPPQTRRDELPKRVSYFLDRHGQFSGAQGRAIRRGHQPGSTLCRQAHHQASTIFWFLCAKSTAKTTSTMSQTSLSSAIGFSLLKLPWLAEYQPATFFITF